MITITREKFIPFSEINVSNSCIFYPDIFSGKIVDFIQSTTKEKSKIYTGIISGLKILTGRKYVHHHKNICFGSCAYVILEETWLNFKEKHDTKKIHVFPGSLLIMGNGFRNDWSFDIPKSIIFTVDDTLSKVFLSSKNRINYRETVRKATISEKADCFKKFMTEKYELGSGCYGNVFRAEISDLFFAVKFSKIKSDAKQCLFSKDFSSWHEIYILEKIANTIIRKNICPNLPMIYDKFYCKNCRLIFKEKKSTHPCVVSVVELANGNFKDFSFTKHSSEEYMSCLFQIMAGLHAIQVHGQIMNFDIKKENILFYNVPPGGYWHYVIHGKNYYVPNYGKLFILNDFGISRSMSPKFCMYRNMKNKTFRLGHRFAIIYEKRFYPLNVAYEFNDDMKKVDTQKITWKTHEGKITSKGAEFRMERKSEKILGLITNMPEKIQAFLNTKNIKNSSEIDFFLYPEIIPPFEFFNDTQDAIRMFIGGKRTTQNGHHGKIRGLDGDFSKKLEKYKSRMETMEKELTFSDNPAKVLAGYFIEEFFDNTEYTHSSGKNIIEKYVISTEKDI